MSPKTPLRGLVVSPQTRHSPATRRSNAACWLVAACIVSIFALGGIGTASFTSRWGFEYMTRPVLLMRKSLNNSRCPDRDPQVWASSVYMTRREQTLLVTWLNSSQTMLEWGSWGSPQHFSQFVNKYYSIEYNATWYQQHVQEMADLGVHYHLQPVEPYHKKWMGKFWAPGNYEQFYEVVNAVADLPGLSKIDRVFIDGRARVACAVRVLPFLRRDSVVFIHGYGPPQDWRWERKYNQVLRFYNLIGLVDSMAVLKPKKEFLGPEKWKTINITSLYKEWYNIWWKLPEDA